ncbi:MAG: transcriptional regulator [Chloroflexi bacterium]|nr:transcriptional regulator [Chloroflexota bacterium]
MTTQEIAERLPGTPKSSIYRHLKTLLAGEAITVAETRPVKGIQEKVYRLAQRPYLGPDDLAAVTANEHLRYFTNYVMTLLQGFSDYLESASPTPDFLADRVGYTEALFYATDAEMDTLQADLNAAFMKLAANERGNGRKRRKIAIVSHPVDS